MRGAPERTRGTIVAAGLAGLSLVFASCLGDDDATPADSTQDGAPSSLAGVEIVRADCRDATFGKEDQRWRERSAVVGSFGLYGKIGRDFSFAVRQPSGVVIAEVPTIIEGDQPAVLLVPEGERSRVGLLYGPAADERELDDSAEAVAFEPCPDQDVTAWRGGLISANRAPVDLEVSAGGGETSTVTVGGPAPARKGGGPPDPAPPRQYEIAFSRCERTVQDRFCDIWVMNADGSDQTRLTHDAEACGRLNTSFCTADAEPAISPDGRRIAFTRQKGSNYRVYIVNSDGTGLVQLTEGPSSSPAWSPDGRRIALDSRIEGPGVYVMMANGTHPTRLTDGGHVGGPVWSPNGRRIAFTRGAHVWTMNADGSDEQRLTRGPAFENIVTSSSPTFSPDGRRIAFLALRKHADSRVVWTMGANGNDAAPLSGRPSTGLDASNPAWSPDGKRIAFVGEDVGGPGIYVMNADGTHQHRLPGGQVNDGDPGWSPVSDGERARTPLVACVYPRGLDGHLEVIEFA